jgi:hypothetical protein
MGETLTKARFAELAMEFRGPPPTDRIDIDFAKAMQAKNP